jgi:hypothetical protein
MTQASAFTRRALLALAVSLALTPALAADAGPTAPIAAIYKRIVASLDKERRNTDNGAFVWLTDKNRRQYFSARTAKLWRDADRLTPKGDQGPLGFDPVTNSQDPLVQSFDLAIEKQDATSATVAVHIADTSGAIAAPTPGGTVRYDMVIERGRWVIDDIRGTIDTAWSLRKILSDYKG